MRSVVDPEPRERLSETLEIRSRWSTPPTSHPEVERLGLALAAQSRLLRITPADASPLRLDAAQLAAILDPLAEELCADTDGAYLDVFPRPGVTDAEGETASLALSLAGAPDLHCQAGRRYRFAVPVPPNLRPQAERLLGNPLIHVFAWGGFPHPLPPLPRERGLRQGASQKTPLSQGRGAGGEGKAREDAIPLDGLDNAALLAVSRRLGLALDLAEMQAIRDHFRALGRAPSDVELQSLAQTWSEHCSHKTFKAIIDVQHDGRHEVIEGLLATCFVAPTTALDKRWVRSAFVDNAGVIAFDAHHDLAFKVETHNHPSALEPFGGAHTGVGGVIRDVLAVSAEPIANTDVLCFGPPDLDEAEVPPGIFHPRTMHREVVRGVADYGNNMGIPTVGGAILFHPGYTANPLVYCGTVGLAPRGRHPTVPQAGDAVVVLGGRTGRDGLHGATMSSAGLDRAQVEGSVVQIGNPIVEKTVRDVLPLLRDEGLYHAITDCGAGGFCSAVGEMGQTLGVEVELSRVPLKYEGLHPWEIWLSEAQERMVLAVPACSLPRLLDLCRDHDVEASVIGQFAGDGVLRVRWHGQLVAELDMEFLHHGRPPRRLEAVDPHPQPLSHGMGEGSPGEQEVAIATSFPLLLPLSHEWERGTGGEGALLALLAHPSIASKEAVIRQYDHEVGAATIVKPLAGHAGPSDAAVLKPLPGSWRGAVIAHGINPLYGALDPHAMATLAVDEALRNLVAVGGSIDRTALLDNFCWGDVNDPAELGALVRAAQGCRDAALAYGTPFISGKDSLHNTSRAGGRIHSIPGTLLVSALGVIPDVRRTVTMDLKAAGSGIYLLGATAAELGGSHYCWIQGLEGGEVPRIRPGETRRLMRKLTRAIRRQLVLSCHDLSEGGLAVAAAEMAIAGGLGLDLSLDGVRVSAGGSGRAQLAPTEPAARKSGGGTARSSQLTAEELLFSESPGRFLIEVAPDKAPLAEALFRGSPCAALGRVTETPRLTISRGGQSVIDLPVAELDRAWRGA